MILILTQTFAPAKGGMEAYMTGLADELARAGRETVVFADGNDEAFLPQVPYVLKRFGGWRPLRRWEKRRALASLDSAQKIEGVFCDSWKSVESIPQLFSAPIVVLAHGAEYPASPSARKRMRIETALARATAILANSRFTADAVRVFLPRPEDPRLSIVHPPIDPLPDPSPQAHNAMREIIGTRHPVISVLARLEPRKGIDRVIEALPSVVARHSSVVFLIGGGGADRERLQVLAQQKGVRGHVEFLGVIDADAKSALFANSDVFAMPVRRVGTSVEGFGISYAEAAFFGVPCLGGKGSGAEDAVIDGKTGLLCDGENQAEVTAKLLQLLDNEALRRLFGLAARNRARNEFLWSQALPRFLAALK
jgi:phosphatidylinositol alpha-1,6-mannosyltransferase